MSDRFDSFEEGKEMRDDRRPCQIDNDNREKIYGVEGFRVFVWTMGFRVSDLVFHFPSLGQPFLFHTN